MQYLYVFKCESFYKIGFTVDVMSRLSQLYTGNPFEISIVCVYEFPDAESVERVLHQKFLDKRIRGEWFVLSEYDINSIDSICTSIGGNPVSPSLAHSDTLDDTVNSFGWRSARKVMDLDEVNKIANETVEWISKTYSLSIRTALNWKGYAKREVE